MGITFINGEVVGPSGKETVRFLIDSSAPYSLLPQNVWNKIGLKAKRTLEFTFADGTTIKRNVSECYISLPQGDGHTPVILGEDSDEALIGVVTLEILGLVFNPFNRTLQPMKMLLV